MSAVVRAWALLVAASAATTSFALFEARGLWAVAAMLALAVVKSRIILSDYLRLSRVPPIRRGFMVVLVIWAGIGLALAIAAQS